MEPIFGDGATPQQTGNHCEYRRHLPVHSPLPVTDVNIGANYRDKAWLPATDVNIGANYRRVVRLPVTNVNTCANHRYIARHR